jgi:hypothetical protein
LRRALLVALPLILLAGRAQGFVQRVDPDTAKKVAWRTSCVPVTVYLDGFDRSANTYGLDMAAIVKSVAAAAHAWSTDAVSCSGGAPFIEIVPTFAPSDATPPAVANDARNTIIFRNSGDGWSWGDSDALAHTTVWWNPADGHVEDVDIEVNATNPLQIWMNLDEGVLPPPSPSMHLGDGPGYFDLQSTLTHEFGHFLGLLHTCFRPSDGVHPVDDRNQPVPDCSSASAAIEATVMFPSNRAGDTTQRTLSGDEIAAMCAIYAPAKVHDACELDTPPLGCAVAPARRGAPFAALAAALGVVGLAALARRRARVSGRDRARS